jgi:hypothetical protein
VQAIALEKEQAATGLADAKKEIGRLEQSLQSQIKSVAIDKDQSIAERNSVQRENERLQKELQDTKNRFDRDTAGRNESVQEVEAARTKLQDAQSKMRELKKETANKLKTTKSESQAELATARKDVSSLGFENDRLKAVVMEKSRSGTKESAEAAAKVAKLQAEVDRLRGLLKEGANKSSNLRDKKAAESLSRGDKLQDEVDRLRALLKEATTSKNSNQRNKENADASASTAALEEEVDHLQALLSDANGKNSTLRAEKVALRKELVQRHRSRRDVDCQTDFPQVDTFSALRECESHASNDYALGSNGGGGSNKVITERVVRIRDAAERAKLVRDYRYEMDRLKAQHEAEKGALSTKHNNSLEDVIKTAKAELSSRSKDYKRRLQSEYDAKIVELERKHADELQRVRCHCGGGG